MKRIFAHLLIALGTLAVTGSALAQTFPSKPLRLIIPFPAGGTADIVARLIAAKFAERVGQSVISENRVGAGALIGSELVAKSAPDGYTFLIITTGTHLLNSLVNRKNGNIACTCQTPVIINCIDAAQRLIAAIGVAENAVNKITTRQCE